MTMIGIAAVFGAISIFVADYWIKSSAASRVEQMTVEVETPEVKFNTIVVAKEPLRYGMTLDRAQLSEIAWPQDALPQGAFTKADDLFAEGERVVLSPIEPNEPVLMAKLSGPNGRASLSNMLAPGMRAVTIKTDEIAGVGGFITPGDRVDVVLTRDAGQIAEVAKNAAGAAGSTLTTEVVLENAKVLSVGQGADIMQTAPQVANSVTIEVTAEGAQRVALARTIGALSLSLRASSEGGEGGLGLTTISDFAGSITSTATAKASALFGAVADEPEGPVMKTIMVRHGAGEPQPHKVLAPLE